MKWSVWKNVVLLMAVTAATLRRVAQARGMLLLYRPRDVSDDCVFSHKLRYDISFGYGLSDTISLVFRTLTEMDYECGVDLVTDSRDIYLLVVIRFPNAIGMNCPVNRDAFTVQKKNHCIRICDVIGDRDLNSPYFIISVRGRIRFQFLSNSSINMNMDASVYQVTATSARQKPPQGCNIRNETICVIDYDEYCFSSGVVCDGIKNCGVADWFDERKSECELPVERIGHAPVVAVVALVLCLVLAAGHLMVRFLPPLANSFFIFNANEDNRLCIDPVFLAPDYVPYDIDKAKRVSIIPVSSTSSDEAVAVEPCEEAASPWEENKAKEVQKISISEEATGSRRKNTMRVMTEKFQQRLRAVTGRRKSNTPSEKHDT